MLPAKRTAVGAGPEAMTLNRELTLADFEKQFPSRDSISVVQRISHRHKTAARCIAVGIPVNEVAEIVGYSPERVSQMLRNDPAFQNLVAEYTATITDAVLDEAKIAYAKVLMVGNMSLDAIIDRLEDPETLEKISTAELRNLMADSLSRTVAPPKQTQPTTVAPTKIVFNVGNKILKEPRTIEHERASHEQSISVIEDQGSS